MSAAIDVQDVTRDRRGVGQVHDRIHDVFDRRRPAHRRQALHHLLRRVPVQRRVDGAGRDSVHADAVPGRGERSRSRETSAPLNSDEFRYNPTTGILFDVAARGAVGSFRV